MLFVTNNFFLVVDQRKVKSHFEVVDQLFTEITSATVKHKTRQPKFATIGCPPHLLVPHLIVTK